MAAGEKKKKMGAFGILNKMKKKDKSAQEDNKAEEAAPTDAVSCTITPPSPHTHTHTHTHTPMTHTHTLMSSGSTPAHPGASFVLAGGDDECDDRLLSKAPPSQ